MAEIQNELRRLAVLHEQLAAQRDGLSESYAQQLTASHLQRFYKHSERILLLLTWELRGMRAHGVNWPHRLLHEATKPATRQRAAIISMPTQGELRQLLAFRNRARNIYGYTPHPECLNILTGATRNLYPRFTHEIAQYQEGLLRGTIGAA